MKRENKKANPIKKKKKSNTIKSPLMIGLLFSVLVLVTIAGSFVIDRTINKNVKDTAASVSKQDKAESDDNLTGDDRQIQSETVENSETSSQTIDEETTTQQETVGDEETTTQEETSTSTGKGEGEYPGVKKVYLTFDDGPSSITSQILDVLDSYNVKATFFTVCNTSEEAIQNMKRIVNSGHSIAIHSVSHKYSTVYASLDSFKDDVLGMQQFIYENTGYKTFLYRFPGGSSNTIAQCDINECIQFLNDAGFEYFDWNSDSGDATGNMIPKDTIVNNVLSSLGSREEYVVLMHDAEPKKTTLEALPEIIEGIQSMGYEILPITENTHPVHHRRK